MLENLSFGLSTALVGMLVVFSGLIILILCIYIMGTLAKRPAQTKKDAPAPQATPAPAPVQETAAPEADENLIAVITAAIAAVWQGEQSSFVVRRVRRSDSMNARARAAREEQIYTHL